MFLAKHYFNYSKVAEDITMEGYALYYLCKAHLVCEEFEQATESLKKALGLLTLEEHKDWEDIIDANHALAKALTALGREGEAKERLERTATIEETICAKDMAA
jgi:tetratricopeptide (TPR) repeat protein